MLWASMHVIVYNYFMPLWATVKSIAPDAVDDPTHYHTRPSTASRGEKFDCVRRRHVIVVLLPNQSKNMYQLCKKGLVRSDIK